MQAARQKGQRLKLPQTCHISVSKQSRLIATFLETIAFRKRVAMWFVSGSVLVLGLMLVSLAGLGS
jgi:hypothetical protein